ncbi:MAG: proteobacterial dedicated sortase system response regulator [Magnetococcales bacterium]|nr:proteobacterial dedicated sortase system response regulator [Magnetococcales bacterium]
MKQVLCASFGATLWKWGVQLWKCRAGDRLCLKRSTKRVGIEREKRGSLTPEEVITVKKRVAIVEDEEAIRENTTDALTRHGYQVTGFTNRPDAITAFRRQLPDLAILDIGLEDEADGGFDLCRELRGLSSTLPILFLTARDSELDTVSGLRLGADDYVTKDVSIPHLLARIAALFRRIDALRTPATSDTETGLLSQGPLSMDENRMQVRWDGIPVDLTLTEFWITHALARYPGHVKNPDKLMEAANIIVDDSTIRSHIKRIRRKFQECDTSFNAVETVYGMGYRWRPATEVST